MRLTPTWLRRARSRYTARVLQRRGVIVGEDVRLYGRPRIGLARPGGLTLGDRVVLTSSWKANDLDAPYPCTIRTLTPEAIITIGSDSGLTSATLSCAYRISIGDRVLIGAGVLVTDTDHHPVDDGWDSPAKVRRRSLPRPTSTAHHQVTLGDDVFVGARSIILKGTTVGAGSVIGAGSVVSGAFEPGVVIAGNPATVVRRLRTDQGRGGANDARGDDELG